MPIVQISILEGRSRDQINAMYREVTEAIHRTIDTPRENVRIILHEIPNGNFAVAGEPKSRSFANPPAGRAASG